MNSGTELDRKQRTKTETRKNSQAKLPWWVELLFVQVGLPDSWLPSILKTRKDTIKLISENRQNIYYLILLTITLLYLYPTVKSSRMSNNCINEYISILRNEDEKNKNIPSDINYNLKAQNFCLGGTIDY